MKIHVLAENTATSPELQAEHGLSLLIEACDTRILFDMGATSRFAANAAHMGQILATVNIAIISHGHYDHGGGLLPFLTINEHAPVWVSPHAFEPHFNANGKDIGLLPRLAEHPRLHRAPGEQYRLAPGLTLYSGATLPTPYRTEGAGMSTERDGHLVADDFRHEQYLMVEENGLRVLFSGCSHRGILNIAQHFRPDVLIGGFHFMKADMEADAPYLRRAAEVLLAQPTQYYTGHCTGEAAYSFLKPLMGERLQSFHTGTVLTLTGPLA